MTQHERTQEKETDRPTPAKKTGGAMNGTGSLVRPRPRRRKEGGIRANESHVIPSTPAPGDDMQQALAAWRMMLKEVAAALVSLRHMAIRQGEERLAETCAPLILELMDVQERLAAETGPGKGREGSRDAGGAIAPTDGLLTARERECLRWCAAGKTYWETALILGIAERTVDFHMQSARRKLGADSNAACVARALLLGLL